MVVTGHVAAEIRHAAIEAVAAAYMLKPADPFSAVSERAILPFSLITSCRSYATPPRTLATKSMCCRNSSTLPHARTASATCRACSTPPHTPTTVFTKATFASTGGSLRTYPTTGLSQPRLKPGVAIHILRDCLAALAALHRDGVTHSDLKPSNVMLKRTGLAKVVDIESAADLRSAEGRRAWSPLYAAPEVLDGAPVTPQSDLASLGYILVEMLAGRSPFDGAVGIGGLLEAKRTLEHRLAGLLPTGQRVAGESVSASGSGRPG